MKSKNTSSQPLESVHAAKILPLEAWINTVDACKYLGISVPTIRRWIKSGKINPKRTPTGEYRFRRSELDNLLN